MARPILRISNIYAVRLHVRVDFNTVACLGYVVVGPFRSPSVRRVWLNGLPYTIPGRWGTAVIVHGQELFTEDEKVFSDSAQYPRVLPPDDIRQYLELLPIFVAQESAKDILRLAPEWKTSGA